MTVAEVLDAYVRNKEWVDANFDSLTTRYADRYIAVANQQVVADAPSIEDLHKALEGIPNLPPKDEIAIVYLTRDPRGMLL